MKFIAWQGDRACNTGDFTEKIKQLSIRNTWHIVGQKYSEDFSGFTQKV